MNEARQITRPRQIVRHTTEYAQCTAKQPNAKMQPTLDPITNLMGLHHQVSQVMRQVTTEGCHITIYLILMQSMLCT